MCVFTCVHMSVGLHAYVYMGVWRSASDVFFLKSQGILRRGFFLAWDLVSKLGWTVGELQGSPISASPARRL